MTATASQPTANRRTATENVATAHLLISSLFLVLGSLLTLLMMASVSFIPLSGPLSYGRLRPMAMLVIMLGWLIPAFTGVIYYLLPRLTGAPLAHPRLASLGLVGTGAITVVGILLLGIGFGDGIEPFGLPWWMDALILIVTLIPLVVTITTIRSRNESGVFASLWFVLAAVVWLPIVALVSTIPGLGSLGRMLQGVTFTAGFNTLWVMAMGFAVAYYVAVKQTDQPLANRQVAKAGFWSLAFAGAFLGPVQVTFGPTPGWLDSVAAVLVLALPVAAVATTMSVVTTIDKAWKDFAEKPALLAVGYGLAISVVVGVLSSLGSFSTASSLVGLTAFWDGVLFMVLFGVGGSFMAAFAYQAIPAMTGKSVDGTGAVTQIKLTANGALLTGLSLTIAGVLSGFAWTAGSFSGAYEEVGAGWSEAMALPNVFIGLAAAGALVAVLGQLLFVRNVVSALTTGAAGIQEILVYSDGSEDTDGDEPEGGDS